MYGLADDGRLLQSEYGNVVAASSYSRIWKRACESVDVLLKIYAKCIDGQEAEMNDRIMRGLGEAPE